MTSNRWMVTSWTCRAERYLVRICSLVVGLVLRPYSTKLENLKIQIYLQQHCMFDVVLVIILVLGISRRHKAVVFVHFLAATSDFQRVSSFERAHVCVFIQKSDGTKKNTSW